MKLKSVATYQHVRFENANDSFFTIDNPRKYANIELTLLDGAMIEIKSPKDRIIIFTTNVAYVVPADAAVKVVKAK